MVSITFAILYEIRLHSLDRIAKVKMRLVQWCILRDLLFIFFRRMNHIPNASEFKYMQMF